MSRVLLLPTVYCLLLLDGTMLVHARGTSIFVGRISNPSGWAGRIGNPSYGTRQAKVDDPEVREETSRDRLGHGPDANQRVGAAPRRGRPLRGSVGPGRL